jgi:hypothetical protein
MLCAIAVATAFGVVPVALHKNLVAAVRQLVPASLSRIRLQGNNGHDQSAPDRAPIPLMPLRLLAAAIRMQGA